MSMMGRRSYNVRDLHGSNARHRQKTFRPESSAPGRRRRRIRRRGSCSIPCCSGRAASRSMKKGAPVSKFRSTIPSPVFASWRWRQRDRPLRHGIHVDPVDAGSDHSLRHCSRGAPGRQSSARPSRCATQRRRRCDVRVAAKCQRDFGIAAPQTISLGSGESRDISWNLTAPAGIDSLKYQIEATAGEGIGDRTVRDSESRAAVPSETYQATLTQLSGDYRSRCGTSQRRPAGIGRHRRVSDSRLLSRA